MQNKCSHMSKYMRAYAWLYAQRSTKIHAPHTFDRRNAVYIIWANYAESLGLKDEGMQEQLHKTFSVGIDDYNKHNCKRNMYCLTMSATCEFS
jgi:hypothetical protein